MLDIWISRQNDWKSVAEIVNRSRFEDVPVLKIAKTNILNKNKAKDGQG